MIIHSEAAIGDDCNIGSNGTFGGCGGRSNKAIPKFDNQRRNVPFIGNRVIIGTDAKLIGPFVIGDDVVINDVLSCYVVGGVPAKILYMKDNQ